MTPKAGPKVGSGGKRRAGLKGKGRTLPADERPWHKGYSGDEPLPKRTKWKQDKEKRAAAAEGRSPKVGQPGTKVTSRKPSAKGAAKTTNRPAGPRVAAGRRAPAAKDAPELLVGRNPVVEAMRAGLIKILTGLVATWTDEASWKEQKMPVDSARSFVQSAFRKDGGKT